VKLFASVTLILLGFLVSTPDSNAQEAATSAVSDPRRIVVVGCRNCENFEVELAEIKYPGYVGYGPHTFNGVVNVQIQLNEKGEIIDTLAVSGHPYFRPMLEKESRRHKFIPKEIRLEPSVFKVYIAYKFELGVDDDPTAKFVPILNGAATNLSKPKVPKLSVEQCISGKVFVKIRVNSKGFVTKAEAVFGESIFRDAAVKAARKATFDPGRSMSYGYLVYRFPLAEICSNNTK
jgi:hypothetical protein